MTRQRDGDSGPRTGGRSGNDFLARGGEGYQSWAAEGPSGTAAEGGPPGDVPSLEDTVTWRTKSGGDTGSESRGGGLLTLLVGVGVGAALAYFLDRERGAVRRQQVAEQLKGAVKSGQRVAEGAVAGVRARVSGGNGASSPHASTASVVSEHEDPLDAGSSSTGFGSGGGSTAG